MERSVSPGLDHWAARSLPWSRDTQQVGGRNLETLSKPDQRQQGHIAIAGFDCLKHPRAEATTLGGLFLRPFTREPKSSDVVRECSRRLTVANPFVEALSV